MIDFHRPDFKERQAFQALLAADNPRGCESTFNNVFMWGYRQIAFIPDFVLVYSQFGDFRAYSMPIGTGDRKAAIELLRADAKERGIPFRIIGVSAADRQELEELYPGEFGFESDRDSFDYVYDIHALADMPGRKLQKKRNHVNKFASLHPDWYIQEITPDMVPTLREMVQEWYALREPDHKEGLYDMEKTAIDRAFSNFEAMELEGIVLKEGDNLLAFTMGSRMREDMFDAHFEKAREFADGTYAMINREFARFLRQKHPKLTYIDREDDMGLEGLRQAKCAYNPHHMIEKQMAYLLSEGTERD